MSDGPNRSYRFVSDMEWNEQHFDDRRCERRTESDNTVQGVTAVDWRFDPTLCRKGSILAAWCRQRS